MESKRTAILNQLLVNIEKSQADKGDVKVAIFNFRQFIAALQGEIDYKISQLSLMPEISEKVMQNLFLWLQSHEDDIVNEINDFGDLKEIYQELCGQNKRSDWIQKCDEICNQQHIKTFCKEPHIAGY